MKNWHELNTHTEEVDLLARLIKSEALGEGEQGMLLVGNVVINRVVANCDVFRNVPEPLLK